MANPTGKYWRLQLLNGLNPSQVSVGELQFLEAGGVNQINFWGWWPVSEGGEGRCSSSNVNDNGSSAFDTYDDMGQWSGGVGNYWMSELGQPYPHWIQYRYDTAIAIRRYGIHTGSTAAQQNNRPTEWLLQCSNDQVNWTDVDYKIGQNLAFNTWTMINVPSLIQLGLTSSEVTLTGEANPALLSQHPGLLTVDAMAAVSIRPRHDATLDIVAEAIYNQADCALLASATVQKIEVALQLDSFVRGGRPYGDYSIKSTDASVSWACPLDDVDLEYRIHAGHTLYDDDWAWSDWRLLAVRQPKTGQIILPAEAYNSPLYPCNVHETAVEIRASAKRHPLGDRYTLSNETRIANGKPAIASLTCGNVIIAEIPYWDAINRRTKIRYVFNNIRLRWRTATANAHLFLEVLLSIDNGPPKKLLVVDSRHNGINIDSDEVKYLQDGQPHQLRFGLRPWRSSEAPALTAALQSELTIWADTVINTPAMEPDLQADDAPEPANPDDQAGTVVHLTQAQIAETLYTAITADPALIGDLLPIIARMLVETTLNQTVKQIKTWVAQGATVKLQDVGTLTGHWTKASLDKLGLIIPAERTVKFTASLGFSLGTKLGEPLTDAQAKAMT